MSDDTTHLDHALAEEFAGHSETIHRLKMQRPHFANLLTRNRGLWDQIQAIQKGIDPAEDAVLDQLERQRLAILDEIAAAIASAENH